jgi:hypothetical protein
VVNRGKQETDKKAITPLIDTQALEFRTPLFPHLVPPAIMVWIFVWKYIFEPFIHILQHFVLQLSRSSNFLFLGPAAVLLIYMYT